MRSPTSIPFPTRRLAIAVAACALLWLIPGTVGIAMALAALLALFVITLVEAVFFLPPSSAIDVERDIAESVGIGDTVRGQYVIRSRWTRRIDATLYDAPGAGVIRHAKPPFVVTLPPRGERVVPLDLEGRSRAEPVPAPA